ncbi:hypothetical protein V6N13_064082 [Hibiscus sabdariffa]|uniref:Uncharacterized protein n=1 Tax=Hibiscus sabdariffa TaxID=183260 RepID=A0ABR2R2T2_9ROSI
MKKHHWPRFLPSIGNQSAKNLYFPLNGRHTLRFQFQNANSQFPRPASPSYGSHGSSETRSSLRRSLLLSEFQLKSAPQNGSTPPRSPFSSNDQGSIGGFTDSSTTTRSRRGRRSSAVEIDLAQSLENLGGIDLVLRL